MTDFRNLLFFGGLGLFGSGLWLQSPALALSAVGGILLIVWFIVFWKAAKGR